MAPTPANKVKPVFIRTRDLPPDDDSNGSITTREICAQAEKRTGYDTMEGAQRIGGLWRVYPKTEAARIQLLLEGLSIRNVHVRFQNENPFLVRNHDSGGSNVDTTKLFVSNIPISFSNQEIENKLQSLGCKPVSKLIEECDRDERGKLTRWKTGRRFIFIVVPSTPLPAQINVGMFTARLYHREQKSEPFCGNCLQNGHRKQDCQADVVCRLCKKTGHKSGEQLCEVVTKRHAGEVTLQASGSQTTTTSQNEASDSDEEEVEENRESDTSGDESTSNEGSQLKFKKNKKRKTRKGKGSHTEGSSAESSSTERRSKIANTGSTPKSAEREAAVTDTRDNKSETESRANEEDT